MSEESRAMSDEERAAAIRQQLRDLHIVDLAYDMMVSLVTVGYQKLGLTPETAELRDLDDARLSIELLRAVLDVVEPAQGAEAVRDLRGTLAQMQLNYARAVQRAGEERRAEPPTARPEEHARPADEPSRPADEPARPAEDTVRADELRRPVVPEHSAEKPEGAPEKARIRKPAGGEPAAKKPRAKKPAARKPAKKRPPKTGEAPEEPAS